MQKDVLIKEFEKAQGDSDYAFVILEVLAEGIREFIVIPRESFEDKLAFYKRSYTDELIHVMNKNVSITNVAAAKHILTNRLFD